MSTMCGNPDAHIGLPPEQKGSGHEAIPLLSLLSLTTKTALMGGLLYLRPNNFTLS